jgi:hypothetical protein
MPDPIQHNLEVIADESFEPDEPSERLGRDRLYDETGADDYEREREEGDAFERDRWRRMTPGERDAEIRDALRISNR